MRRISLTVGVAIADVVSAAAFSRLRRRLVLNLIGYPRNFVADPLLSFNLPSYAPAATTTASSIAPYCAGLDDWPTHLAYVDGGRLAKFGVVQSFTDLMQRRAAGLVAPLLRTIESWLRQARDVKQVGATG